jgi:2-desacetyl-2-hydroxyethyl bacteriochlorophyllide A dehydrogenase
MVESKVWVWTAAEKSELQTEAVAAPGPGQVLIKTRYSAISPGTEMALYMGTHVGFADPDNHYAKYPHRGGYLNIGIVEAAGEEAAADWPVGTWVYSAASHRRYALVDTTGPWSCRRLPEALQKPEAAYLGLVKVGYTAPYMAPSTLGKKIAVLGAGLVGNFAAQLYNASGADVVSVERDDFRRDIAEKCGLKTVGDTSDVEKALGEAPGIVVEATGVPALCVKAMEMAAQGGRVLILSSPRGEAPVNFYNHIHSKLISVIGAHGKAVTDGVAADRLLYSMAADGKVTLAPCVTHKASWKDAAEVWDTYAHNPVKRLGTILDWEA